MIGSLGVLALAALLAQVPAPTETPSAPATPTAVQPGPTAGGEVRRGPQTTPRMNGPHATPDDVTIVNSGSTNSAGYTIVVHPDASAEVVIDGTAERKTVGRAQARWLLAKVRAAGPLERLPGGRCMKSMSFGTATTISYANQTSPDLTCHGDATTQELVRTAGVIAAQLEIPRFRARGVPIR